MKSLVLITNDLSEVSIEELLRWQEPLLVEKHNIKVIPIFEIKNPLEESIFLNSYNPEVVIKVHSEHHYSIKEELVLGKNFIFLYIPPFKDLNWKDMKLALDRLEELL